MMTNSNDICKLGLELILSNKMLKLMEQILSLLELYRSDPTYAKECIYIYPHSRADGDAYGSSFALQRVFTSIGIRSKVVLSEAIYSPFDRYISSLSEADYYVYEDEWRKVVEEETEDKQALAILIDCNDLSRIGDRAKLIPERIRLLIIDHHVETQDVDKENSHSYYHKYINSSAAAICQDLACLFFALEKKIEKELIDKDTATLLYAGMLTDSNRFTYSQVTDNTLLIAAMLKARGVDQERLCRDLFETKSFAQIRAESIIINNLMSFYNSKINISYITLRDMIENEILEEDLVFAPSFIREIEGCRLSIFLRETEKGNIRGNVRSILPYSARNLALRYGGGGHICASGFSIMNKTLDESLEDIIEMAISEVKRQELEIE